MSLMDANHLLDRDALAVGDARRYPRPRLLFQEFQHTPGRPFVALVGPRGTGKTVMLRQLRARTKDALYVSADTLDRGDRLVDLVRLFLDRYRVQAFFVDEIHYLRDYAAELKEIYDFLPVRIWFTSSVAVSLYASAADLSRRVRVMELLPFAFREYLQFSGGEPLPLLSLATAFGAPIPAAYLRTSFRFAEYLTGGLYPFMLQAGSVLDLFGNIVEKVIRGDLPAHDPNLTGADLANIEQLLKFVGRSPIDGINYTSLSAADADAAGPGGGDRPQPGVPHRPAPPPRTSSSCTTAPAATASTPSAPVAGSCTWTRTSCTTWTPTWARPPTCSPATPRWCANCATATTPAATTWATPEPASLAPTAGPPAASTTPAPCCRCPKTISGYAPSTTDAGY